MPVFVQHLSISQIACYKSLCEQLQGLIRTGNLAGQWRDIAHAVSVWKLASLDLVPWWWIIQTLKSRFLIICASVKFHTPKHSYTCTHARTYTNIHTYMQTCANTHTYTHTHTHMHKLTHTYTHTFTDLHTRANTDTHTHTHTRTQTHLSIFYLYLDQ